MFTDIPLSKTNIFLIKLNSRCIIF